MIRHFKKSIRFFSAILFLGLVVTAGVGVYAASSVPDSFNVTPESPLNLQSSFLKIKKDKGSDRIQTLSLDNVSRDYTATVSLLEVIPVKTVNVHVVDEVRVSPAGTPFGIKMLSNGVLVVGLSGISTISGEVSPAEKAGIKTGDLITKVNGTDVRSNDELAALVQKSNGSPVELTVLRGETVFTARLTPAKTDTDSTYKIGMWVRDSIAGLGTVTFYNADTGMFAGLGHGICDSDTGELMPLLSGEIVPVSVTGCTKGTSGGVGSLHGYFSGKKAIGTLLSNTETGVYGQYFPEIPEGKSYLVAMKQDVCRGDAQIIATVDENGPQTYSVRIESVNYSENKKTKNIVLRVTDERLLGLTGGIVQGMSGSPILQNGKLVGAVTHVFLDDPTSGYGIFAETMLSELLDVYAQNSSSEISENAA